MNPKSKRTQITLSDLINSKKPDIKAINTKARIAIKVGSPSTWSAKKRNGNLNVSQIIKLASFLDIHPTKIFQACQVSQSSYRQDTRSS